MTCARRTLSTLSGANAARPQDIDRGVAFEKKGFRLVGWIPFGDRPNGSVPTVKLQGGNKSIDYPVKLYVISDPFGAKTTFQLCMAANHTLDAKALTLVAVASTGQEIAGLTHSTLAETAGELQIVVFHGRVDVHFRTIAKILLMCKTDGADGG